MTRLSKLEEDNIKMLKNMDEMTVAIDSVNDLNIRVLRIFNSRNIETQVYVDRRRRNSN